MAPCPLRDALAQVGVGHVVQGAESPGRGCRGSHRACCAHTPGRRSGQRPSESSDSLPGSHVPVVTSDTRVDFEEESAPVARIESSRKFANPR